VKFQLGNEKNSLTNNALHF